MDKQDEKPTFTYISLTQQELRSCKKIGDEFYCKELFIVKHKSSYSCVSAIYFNLSTDIIRNNCNFDFYYMRLMSLLQFWMEEMK